MTAGRGTRRPALPPDVDAALREVGRDPVPEAAALSLALIIHRAANELHRLSRGRAAERRGEPDWGTWASLQNASRDVVLKGATLRQTAGQLAASADDPESG